MRFGDYNCRFLLMFIIVSICSHNAVAQTDSIENKQSTYKLKNIFSSGLGVQHGFIFAHSQAVQNTKGSYPTGVEVILSWQRNDASIWELCNCFPRKGLLLAYYDYDNAILGKVLQLLISWSLLINLGKIFFSLSRDRLEFLI